MNSDSWGGGDGDGDDDRSTGITRYTTHSMVF